MRVILIAFALIASLSAGVARADGGIQTGKNFGTATIPSGSVTMLIPPSANVNGIYLQTMNLVVNPGTGALFIYANATAPAGIEDPNSRAIFVSSSSTGGTSFANMPNSIYLRPGIGLYGVSNVTSWASISYDIVN